MRMASAATNMLDEYLQATSIGRQCSEQAVHCPVPAQTAFLHAQVLKGVHDVLDSTLPRSVTSSPTPWGQAHQQQAPAARLGAWSPDKAAPAAKPNASTNSNRTPATPKGLFRAMRQADASALYAEQLAAQTQPGVISRQQHIQQMEQQPLFAGTDGLTSEVRLLADHAALTSKLQRLQQDMEVRSYRQSLLHRLQQPSALFNESQVSAVPHQRQQQQDGVSTMPRCSSAIMWQPGDSMMQPEPRPCTAPKPSVFKQAASGTQTAAAGAAYSAANAHSSSQRTNSAQQQQQQAASQAGSSAACLLASKAPAQMKHLKQLADLELPWKPPAAAGNPKALSGLLAGSYRAAAQQHSRPGSPCGSSRSGSSSAGAHGQRLFLQPDQQQAPSVPRPASAVAALQQSLSELASLKAKYGQQRQQLEEEQQQQLRAQQEQRWQQEQHQRSQEQHMRDMRREAWLQEAASAQHSTHTLHAAAPGTAREALGRGSPARASIWADQDTGGLDPGLHGQSSQAQQRRSSSGLGAQGYSRWDAWQQQVHSDRHVVGQTRRRDVAGAAALAAELSQGLLRQQAVRAALHRSKSAPRLHRAWDEPLQPSLCRSQQQQQRSSADEGVSRLGRRSSSPGAGLGGGGLQSSWEDSIWQLRSQQFGELRRPTTAGARVGASGSSRPGAGAGLNTGMRSGSAATAAGWLNSSPAKRATRMASVQDTGVLTATAAAVAAGRYRPAGGAGSGAAQAVASSLRSGAGATAGSSWLSAGAGGVTGRLGQQAQRAAVGTSIPTRLRSTTAGVTGVLGNSATQRSWLAPQGACQQAPVGACKAALLASRAPAAAGVGATGAAPGSAAARRQELVQRALNGYKPQQVARRSTSNGDTSSVNSEDSRPSSFAPATAAAGAGSHRESAYAAALARLQAAKQGKPLSSTNLSRGLSTRDDDCSSSSSTNSADDDSSVGG